MCSVGLSFIGLLTVVLATIVMLCLVIAPFLIGCWFRGMEAIDDWLIDRYNKKGQKNA